MEHGSPLALQKTIKAGVRNSELPGKKRSASVIALSPNLHASKPAAKPLASQPQNQQQPRSKSQQKLGTTAKINLSLLRLYQSCLDEQQSCSDYGNELILLGKMLKEQHNQVDEQFEYAKTVLNGAKLTQKYSKHFQQQMKS